MVKGKTSAINPFIQDEAEKGSGYDFYLKLKNLRKKTQRR